MGVGGSGRQSCARLATYVANFRVYQIEIVKGYNMNNWRENLRECLLNCGLEQQPTNFLFVDTQIVDEAQIEDLNGVLNTGDVPNLYEPEDMEDIQDQCRADCIKKQI